MVFVKFANSQNLKVGFPFGHSSDVGDCSFVFSKTDKYLITASQDKTVQLWEFATGRVISTITYDKNPQLPMGLPSIDLRESKNNYAVVIYDNSTAIICDFNHERIVKAIYSDSIFIPIRSCEFSESGMTLLIVYSNNVAKVFNTVTGDLKQEFNYVRSAYFLQGEDIFICSSVQTNFKTIGKRGEIKSKLQFSKDTIIYSNLLNLRNAPTFVFAESDSIFILNVSKNKISYRFPSYGISIYNMVVSDSNTLTIFSTNGELRIIDLVAQNILPINMRIHGVPALLSPKGKYLAYWNPYGVKVVSVKSDSTIFLVKYPNSEDQTGYFDASPNDNSFLTQNFTSFGLDHLENYRLKFNQDERYLGIANGDSVVVVDIGNSGNPPKIFKGFPNDGYGAYVTEDCKKLRLLRYSEDADQNYIDSSTASNDFVPEVSIQPLNLMVSFIRDTSSIGIYTNEYSFERLHTLVGPNELHWISDYLDLIHSVSYSPSQRFFMVIKDDICSECFDPWGSDLVSIYDTKSNSLVKEFKVSHEHFGTINDATFFSNEKYILSTDENPVITRVWDWRTGRMIKEFDGNTYNVDLGPAISSFFSRDGRFIICNRFNCKYDFYTTDKFKLAFSVIVMNNKVLFLLPDGHYMANSALIKKLYFINEKRTLGFEQLDIKYNRPDIVLSKLGSIYSDRDTSLINSYYRAWQKRIQKLGIDTTGFQEGFSVPEGDFENRDNITYEQTEDKIKLRITGVDPAYKLDRYNVWVNDVPIFGLSGKSIRKDNLNKIRKDIEVNLGEGQNKIETSVTNVNGIESYRVPLYVKYTPSKPSKPKLYFVGIGINHFKNGHDLTWSVKDIKDLADSLKSIYGSAMETDTLFNTDVTIENVKALKKKLKNTTVDDKVIVAYSGHGLLSKDYDYYLSTYDVNFEKPEEGGLPYEDLEWLIDSIPARKKLMLIDACHSGEVDKEGYEAMSKTADSLGIGRGFDPPKANKPKARLGLNNSFELMQDLFANVGRGTGATVISAAAGNQYALEKNDLKNGIFTYAILDLMRQKKEVTVDELKDEVVRKVPELTGGLQKPTCRNETQDNNWRVW